MVRAGYRVTNGNGPELILRVDEFNEEYVVVVHVCSEGVEEIRCITAPVDPQEVLRVAEEVEELKAWGYAAAHPAIALEHAKDIAREKFEELKRRYSCNDAPTKSGPN